MKISTRAGALAAGLAMAASIAVPMALPAGAAIKPSVSCKSESSPPLVAGNVKSTLAKCTPTALAAGGTSTTHTAKNQTTGTTTDVITWKGGKGTTTATVKFGPTSKGKCKAPYDSRVKITGKVTKSTGAALKIVKKGEPVTAFICAISKAGKKQGQTILEPGTAFKL